MCEQVLDTVKETMSDDAGLYNDATKCERKRERKKHTHVYETRTGARAQNFAFLHAPYASLLPFDSTRLSRCVATNSTFPFSPCSP